MRKLLLLVVAIAALAFASTASAALLVAVTDPTPDQSFSGAYVIANDDPATPEDESATGTQQGYVGVYDDSVVACNGNPELTRPDNNEPLVGYIFVGSPDSANKPSNTSGGGDAGPVAVGNNHEDANGDPTGNSPCPDADPQGVNEIE